MSIHNTRFLTALAAAGIVATGLVYTPVSRAVNFGDFMNPGKWMGGNRDRDEDWYDYGPGPYGLPPGAGPYGVPYGAPYGAVPGYGPYGPYGGPRYGGAGYGAPGYYGAPRSRPAPRAPATSSSASSSSQNVKSAEIESLKRRIEELEANQQPSYAAPPPPPPADWESPPSSSPSTSGWGSAPAFRPMNKY